MPTFERVTQNNEFISSLCDQPPPPGRFTGDFTKNGVRVLQPVRKKISQKRTPPDNQRAIQLGLHDTTSDVASLTAFRNLLVGLPSDSLDRIYSQIMRLKNERRP